MSPLAAIGLRGHDPLKTLLAEYLTGQHAQRLAHADQLRHAIARQSRPIVQPAPVKSRKSSRRSSVLPKPAPNPTGYNAGHGGTPGDAAHGTGPLGRNGTPSAGGMQVGQ